MIKRGSIILLIIFLLGLCSVNAVVRVEGLTEGQEIVIGSTVSMDFYSDNPLEELYVIAESNSLLEQGVDFGYLYLFHINEIPESEQLTHYGYSWDTSNLPAGVYRISVTYGEYGEDGWQSGGFDLANVVLTNEHQDSAYLRAIRTTSTLVYPGIQSFVYLYILPIEDFTGIIVKELFDSDLEAQPMWHSTADLTRTLPEGKGEFKWVLKDPLRVASKRLIYQITIPPDAAPGTTYNFEGDALVRTNEGGDVLIPTSGVKSISVSTQQLPDCPITDSQLLMHIDRWAKGEITNLLILQIIERWKNCQVG